MNYSLTFELFGSNAEGRRSADWRLGAVPLEGFSDVLAKEAAMDGAAAGGRRALANAGCLPMFNPDTETLYHHVVASWVNNFFVLAEHVARHAASPAAAAEAAPPPPAPAAEASALPRKLGLPKVVREEDAAGATESTELPSAVQLATYGVPASELLSLALLLLCLLAVLLRWGHRAPVIPWLGKRVGLDGVGMRDL